MSFDFAQDNGELVEPLRPRNRNCLKRLNLLLSLLTELAAEVAEEYLLNLPTLTTSSLIPSQLPEAQAMLPAEPGRSMGCFIPRLLFQRMVLSKKRFKRGIPELMGVPPIMPAVRLR